MNEHSRKWLIVSLFNLVIVAFLGCILRYKILYSFTIVDQNNLLHAHFNFAFSGWISQTLFVLIIDYLSKLRQTDLFVRFRFMLLSNLIISYGLLLSFLFSGYSIISTFCTFSSVIIFYRFIYLLNIELSCLSPTTLSKKWFQFALFCLFLSTIGLIAISLLMTNNITNQNWYLFAMYFFLHFQYNGWFFFACVGLFISKIEMQLSYHLLMKKIFTAFSLASIPAFFLSILWIKLPLLIYVLILVAALLQLYGAYLGIRFFNKQAQTIYSIFSSTTRWLFIFATTALIIKLLLQALSTYPGLSHLVFGFRPIVIGYLHLVLLGIITLFLLGYIFSDVTFTKQSITVFGIYIFVLGVFLNEFSLMSQGIANIFYCVIPNINIVLFIIAFTMLSGILLIFLSELYKQIRNI